MQALLWLLSCALVGVWDLVARRVPNRLLIVLAAMQLALMAVSPWATAWRNGLLGLLLGFAILLPFYAIRLMGAGDVKFAGLLGLMCGPSYLFWAWVIAGVCAGLHAGLVYIVRASPDMTVLAAQVQMSSWGRRFDRFRSGRRGIPYAAYLAFGVVVLYGHELHRMLSR